MWSSESATIAFSTVIGLLGDWLEPTARNSNLLPVNANGDVRLRSVASLGSAGIDVTPSCMVPPLRLSPPVPLISPSITSVSCSPR